MKHNNPLISVIVPYFKKKLFILKTLNSILGQSHKNLEIILVYDDPNLSDLNFIKKFVKKDKRIKIYINKKNIGVSKSRNVGIKKSKGDYLAFIDSDDLWKKNKLSTQLKFMKKNECLISHTSYEIISKIGKILGYMSVKKILNYDDLIYSCDIGLSTVMISKELKSRIIFPTMVTKEDYIVWLKLSKKFNIYGIQKNLCSWRKGSFSYLYTWQKIKDAFVVYFKYERFSMIKSLFFATLLSINFLKKSVIQKINYD